jgi:hypothetical protein
MYNPNEAVLSIWDYELEDAWGNSQHFVHPLIVSRMSVDDLQVTTPQKLRRIRDMFNRPNCGIGGNNTPIIAPSQKDGKQWRKCLRVSVREGNPDNEMDMAIIQSWFQPKQ